MSSMSSSLFEYNETPEQALELLRLTVIENWKEKARALRLKDDFFSLWEYAYDTLNYLEHSQLPDVLVELSGYSPSDVKRLWDMISERQREKLIRDIKREIAEMGLEEFLPLVSSVVYSYPNRGIAKQILQKAIDFVDGKTSFDDLMNAVGQARPFNELPRAHELFVKGAALGKYLTKTELKKLVSKYLIVDFL